jgi:hypothetical protein
MRRNSGRRLCLGLVSLPIDFDLFYTEKIGIGMELTLSHFVIETDEPETGMKRFSNFVDG